MRSLFCLAGVVVADAGFGQLGLGFARDNDGGDDGGNNTASSSTPPPIHSSRFELSSVLLIA